jgi:alpha-tubulin suppressor-like RCC1 family protein
MAHYGAGGNDYGQLGDSTNSLKTTPVQIVPSGIVYISSGGLHTCAIKQDSSLWCWGNNDSGQIGNGSSGGNLAIPVQIMSSGVVSVALGYAHTCAIKMDGSLWCWGNNSHGQLGDGTGGDSSLPNRIMSAGVSEISLGGYHTCAIKMDSSLWCWGNNSHGQLGDGTNTDKNTPVQIMPSGVVAVALGNSHTCAIKQDGSLWCWGWNSFGQLGYGTNTDKSLPVQIISSGVSSVSLGGYHTCAIKIDGSLWCWGNNLQGQLGDGTRTNKNTPVQIMSSGVKAVSLGDFHTCAIKQDGSLWCWGDNEKGQLGDETYYGSHTAYPVRIISSGVSSVSLGWKHTCAVKTDGSLWCWGYNGYGQVGVPIVVWPWSINVTSPVQIISSGTSAVSAGSNHTCAVKTDGSLWCWGDNRYGQLGNGTSGVFTSIFTPVQIMSSGVKAVSLGGLHTCAIKQGGSLWCWGWNDYGQLGKGSSWRTTPVYIMNLGSGGGGAPSIFFGERAIFGNEEQKQANIEQKQTRYGCSSANIVFYVLHLIFPAFILFALLKRKFV